MIAKLYSTLFLLSMVLSLSAQSSQTSCLTFNLGTALGDDSQQIEEQVIFPFTTYGYNDVTAWVIDVEYDTLVLEYEGWYPTYFEPNEGPFISAWPGHINIVFYGAENPISIVDGEQLGFFRFNLREGEGSAAGSSLKVETGDLSAQAFGPDFDAISVAIIDGIVPADLEVGQFDPGQACMQSLACEEEPMGSIEIFVPDTVTAPAFYWMYDEQVISTSQNLEALTAGGRYDLHMSAEGQYDRQLSAFLMEESELNSIYVESLQQLDCFDAAVTGILRVSGFDPNSSTILWSNGATTPQIDNLAEGFYSVRVTDILSGCSSSVFGRVYRESDREIEMIIQDDYRCESNAEPNGSISIQITDLGGEPAPDWYIWSPNNLSGPELSGLGAGTYSVTIGGSNDACLTVLETTITTKQLSTAARIEQPVCLPLTGDIELLSIVDGAIYEWSDGSTATNRYDLPIGDYSLTVTAPNGCFQSADYSILNPVEPIINSGLDCSTNEYTLHLNDPLARATWLWDGETTHVNSHSTTVDADFATGKDLTIILDDDCSLDMMDIQPGADCSGALLAGSYSLSLPDVQLSGGAGSTICLPLVVDEFNSIPDQQFDLDMTLVYDPAFLSLEEVNPSYQAIGGLDWNTTTNGLLNIDLNDITANTFWAGLELIELCFTNLTASGSTPILAQEQNWNAATSEGLVYAIAFQAGSVQMVDDLVWPGDANANARVDHYDLLDIGLGFDMYGPAREEVSNYWGGHPGPVWPGNSPLSGANWQHSDADGNGLINISDVLTLELNWEQTRSIDGLPELNYEPNILQSEAAAPLFVLPDTVSNNSGPQTFGIHLGDANYPAYDVYGLAFSVGYDAAALNEEELNVDFLETWLGELEDDLIATYRNFPEEERIDIAISRTDGQSMNGMGRIATLNITIEDVIFRGIDYELMFSIFDQVIVTSAGGSLYSNAQTTTSLITTTTAVQQLLTDERWQIYPNPSSGWLQLTHPEGFRPAEVQIYTLAGQSVYHQTRPDYRLDIAELAAGPYLLKIVGDGTVTMKRFVMR